MADPVTTTTGGPNTTYTPSTQIASAPPPDPAKEAKRILDVGSRWFTDDYDARMDEFARTLQDLPDEASRRALLAEVIRQDPGATRSWLQVDRINTLTDGNRISQVERATLAETIAGAYNDGEFAAPKVPANSSNPHPDWQNAPGQSVSQQVFDGMIWNYGINNYSNPQTNFQHAKEIADFQKFLDSSSGPEVAQLRRTYADHLIRDYALNTNVDPQRRAVAAGTAAEILAGDPSRPELVTNTLGALTPEQRKTFIEQAGHSQSYLSADALRGSVDYVTVQEADVARVAQPDAVAQIFDTVARVPASDAQAQTLAKEFARLPQNSSDLFSDRGNSGLQARTDAMTRLFANHADAILGDLSAYQDVGARDLDNPDRKQYEVNGRDLSALLELTVFNPDADAGARNAARGEMLQYVGEQSKIINDSRNDPNSKGYLDASGRLVVMAAASDVAVDRGYDTLAADRQSKQEAVAFMVDLALAAVPLSTRLKSAASGTISELFANNPAVKSALDGLSGQAIDKVTGQLTEAGKKELYKALDNDPELAKLTERQTIGDAFRTTLLQGVANERDLAVIQRDANALADDISEKD